MLDQSFSAHNFDTIYSLESRKGNIDINTMPEEYCRIIKRVQEIKKEISFLQKIKSKNSEEVENLEKNKLELKCSTESKKSILQEYLEKLEKQVNSHGFRFYLKKLIPKEGKEVFTLDTSSHAHLFAIKQLQYNIRHTFKVKQANRHSILSNIKTFMNSKIPIYVIRTDISGFYESIPHDRLLPMIFDNTLLSHKSKAFIKGILHEYDSKKDTTLVEYSKGVPRGIGISSYLSELYMRDIDAYIASKREVLFYGRYVDDIFLILTALPPGQDLKQYYKGMTEKFLSYGLKLKQENDGSDKCNLIDFTKNDCKEVKMNYLGYCLYMSRKNNKLSTTLGLSDKKKERYNEKIKNTIDHFDTLSKYDIKQAIRDLVDALNMSTGNYKLFKSKSSVKVGLYYNNDLLDRMEDLDNLTNCLHEKNLTPYVGLGDYENIKKKLSEKIKKIVFRNRWKERKMFKFSQQRIKEIEKWL